MEQLHGTTIALNGCGLLIIGPSGSGKSSLALELMATGADLVSDDRTDVVRKGAAVIASAPQALTGKIEARGVGLLNAAHVDAARLALVVDLGRDEEERLPIRHHHDLLGVSLPLVLGPYRSHLYAALRQYLVAGRSD